MINLIRAEVYTILRGKALYITFGAMFILHILVIATQMNIGVNFASVEGIGLDMPDVGFDGIRSAELLYTNTDNIIFFLLPLIILATGPIFTFGTVKNDISWGISRTKLYLSKLLVSMGLCVLMMVFYMGVGMLLATVLNGFGGQVPDGYWINLFQTVGAQLFMLLATTCLGVFLVFLTKSTLAASGLYMGVVIVPAIVITMLADGGMNVLQLLDFDLMIGINRLGFLSQLEARNIYTILGVGALYMLVTTIGGITLFRRAEIK